MHFDPNYLGGTFLLYFVMVYLLKYIIFLIVIKKSSHYKIYCAKKYSFLSLLSIDYLLSSKFKDMLDFYQLDNKTKTKSNLIKSFNLSNLLLTFTILIASIISVNYNFHITFFLWLCSIRFISRLIEISLAFYRDVIIEPERIKLEDDSLNKFSRIKLAVNSYIEVFLISASLYTFTFKIGTAGLFTSLNLSFGVGTLTNTSALLNRFNNPYLETLMYLQIFTTLVLVIMSFAIYISRDK